MIDKIAILGSSGHGKVVAEVAELNGWKNIEFYDDRWPVLSNVEAWNIVGDFDVLLTNYDSYSAIIVAIGDNRVRILKQQELINIGATIISLVHPRAIVSPYATIGIGSVIMAGAVISSFAVVGEAAIINTSATIDHDCILGDSVHVSPGAHLAGAIKVGNYSWIGIGASVKQLIQLGENVVIGAGSVVINNVDSGNTVVGIPAKSLDNK